MKNFKEFTAEQKYVTEIGPVGALVGALVGGIAAYKGGKALWNKVQGYREASAEKKDNAKREVYVNIKKWNNKCYIPTFAPCCLFCYCKTTTNS